MNTCLHKNRTQFPKTAHIKQRRLPDLVIHALKQLCLWAREPRNQWGYNISHLAERICGGDWASERMPAELTWITCDLAIYHSLWTCRRAGRC